MKLALSEALFYHFTKKCQNHLQDPSRDIRYPWIPELDYLLLRLLVALKCLVTFSEICNAASPMAVLNLLFPMEASTLIP